MGAADGDRDGSFVGFDVGLAEGVCDGKTVGGISLDMSQHARPVRHVEAACVFKTPVP